MAKSGGIPGLAVAMATAGGILVYVGVRDVPLLDGLREIIRGKPPTGRPKRVTELPAELRPSKFDQADDGGQFTSPTPGGGSGTGNARIADAARKYLGTPYVWGGHTPQGFDCSGLVTWVLVQDIGLKNLPFPVHTTTPFFYGWTGARDVPRDQCAAGDLVCWPGHIGIAANRDEMIHAPDAGQVVKVSKIWGFPTPRIRRVTMPTTTGGGGLQTR
jgi:cell wall-associated NlpC family hydrolase